MLKEIRKLNVGENLGAIITKQTVDKVGINVRITKLGDSTINVKVYTINSIIVYDTNCSITHALSVCRWYRNEPNSDVVTVSNVYDVNQPLGFMSNDMDFILNIN